MKRPKKNDPEDLSGSANIWETMRQKNRSWERFLSQGGRLLSQVLTLEHTTGRRDFLIGQGLGNDSWRELFFLLIISLYFIRNLYSYNVNWWLLVIVHKDIGDNIYERWTNWYTYDIRRKINYFNNSQGRLKNTLWTKSI